MGDTYPNEPPVASPPASVEEIASRIDEDSRSFCIAWGLNPGVERLLAKSIKRIVEAALLSDRAAMAARVAGLEQKLKSAEATIDTLMRAQEHYREAMDERNTFKNQARASEAEVARLREELAIVRDLPLPETVTTENAGALALSMLHALQWLAARARAALTRPDEPTKET